MFKKGQEVTLIRREATSAALGRDNVITWKVTRARVAAAGKKRMHLADRTSGRVLGRKFEPRCEQGTWGDAPALDYVLRETNPTKVADIIRTQLEPRIREYEMAHARNALQADDIREHYRDLHTRMITFLSSADTVVVRADDGSEAPINLY